MKISMTYETNRFKKWYKMDWELTIIYDSFDNKLSLQEELELLAYNRDY